MRTSEALSHFGGSKQMLAAALDIKVPSIYEWGEFPPPLRQIQLERITGGVLKAEPDVFDTAKGSKAKAVPAQDEAT